MREKTILIGMALRFQRMVLSTLEHQRNQRVCILSSRVFPNPTLIVCVVYKGAMLMPNTFTMQENIRTEVDYYFDNEELGKPLETPFVYSIPKGA